MVVKGASGAVGVSQMTPARQVSSASVFHVQEQFPWTLLYNSSHIWPAKCSIYATTFDQELLSYMCIEIPGLIYTIKCRWFHCCNLSYIPSVYARCLIANWRHWWLSITFNDICQVSLKLPFCLHHNYYFQISTNANIMFNRLHLYDADQMWALMHFNR